MFSLSLINTFYSHCLGFKGRLCVTERRDNESPRTQVMAHEPTPLVSIVEPESDLVMASDAGDPTPHPMLITGALTSGEENLVYS